MATTTNSPPEKQTFSSDLPRNFPGVNLSGAEFGILPGRHGKDYIYPDNESATAMARMGFRIIRIPFRWERLQPELNGALSEFDRAELRRLVTHATDLGLITVLDMHNYARRKSDGKSHVIGSSDVPTASLADAWIRIAEDYRDNPNVWLGLMNEPHSMSAKDWWSVAQRTTDSLRAAKFENVILVPGTAWTGAWTWKSSSNAQFAEAFRDPIGRHVFEVHQYFDSNGSGTSGRCMPLSATRVDEVLEWAESTKSRILFGEIAAGDGLLCPSVYKSVLKKMDRSAWTVGWAAWGGGPWWPEGYPFRIAEPNNDKPITAHTRYVLEHLDAQ